MTAPDLFATPEPPRRGPRLGPRWRQSTTQILREACLIDTPSSRRHIRNVRKYGIHPLQWEMMGHRQEWRCAGCEAPFSEDFSDIRTDHCHATGEVRGLLCHSCNIALGWMRDNSRALRRLSIYLDGAIKKAGNDA